MDTNLVEIWLRFDPKRWIAGIFSGALAGMASLGAGALFSKMGGLEVWYAVKIPALVLLGPGALEIGWHSPAIVTGFILHEAICIFFGFIFAHFTGTNRLAALLPMGLAWGAFSWVFIVNLFSNSFRPVFDASIPAGPAFFVCLVYGLSLASVAFFDRLFRGQ